MSYPFQNTSRSCEDCFLWRRVGRTGCQKGLSEPRSSNPTSRSAHTPGPALSVFWLILSGLLHLLRASFSLMSLSLINLQRTYFFRPNHPWAKDATNTAAWPRLPSQRQIVPCTSSLHWALCSLHMVGGMIYSSSKGRDKFIKAKWCRGSYNSGYKFSSPFIPQPLKHKHTYSAKPVVFLPVTLPFIRGWTI